MKSKSARAARAVNEMPRRHHGRRSRHLGTVVASFLTVTSACTGNVDRSMDDILASGPRREVLETRETNPFADHAKNSGAASDRPGTPLSTSLATELTCTGKAPPPQRVWRLSKVQLQNTLEDLYGGGSAQGLVGLLDKKYYGYANNAEHLLWSEPQSTMLLQTAEGASAKVAAEWKKYMPCATLAAPDEACVVGFIRGHGLKVLRKPLTEERVARLLAMYKALAVDGFGHGVRGVVEALLQSPEFLYRSELGEPDAQDPGLVKLTPWEVASYISYSLWNTTPDEALLTAAMSGQLSTAAGVEAAIAAAAKDAKAQRGLVQFMEAWLDFGKIATENVVRDLAKFPHFTPAFQQALKAETDAFVRKGIYEEQFGVEELFRTRKTWITKGHGDIYGPGVTTASAEPVAVMLPEERAGVVTQAALLSVNSKGNNTGVVDRGLFLLEKVLCHHLPSPAGDVAAEAAMLAAKQGATELTEREFWETATSNPVCQSCHSVINPLGYSLENYDQTGRYRTMEKGKPVNASGTVSLTTSGKPVEFKNYPELIAGLVGDKTAHECTVKQYARYTFGQHESGEDCDVAAMYKDFAAASYKLAALPGILARAKSSLYRKRL